MWWYRRGHSRLLYRVFSSPTTVIGDKEAVLYLEVHVRHPCGSEQGWLKETLFMTLTGTTPTPQTSPGWKHEPDCIYLFGSFLLPIKNCISQFFLFSNHVTQLTKILFPHANHYRVLSHTAIDSSSPNVGFYICLSYIWFYLCDIIDILRQFFFFFAREVLHFPLFLKPPSVLINKPSISSSKPWNMPIRQGSERKTFSFPIK